MFTSILCMSHREGYPNIRTVDHWLGGDKAERYPQSRYADVHSLDNYVWRPHTKNRKLRTMKNHNKADGYERRLEVNLLVPCTHYVCFCVEY